MMQKITIDAFALSDAFRESLLVALRDRRLSQAVVNFRDGGLAGAVAYYAGNINPAVIIVEEQGDDATLLAEIDALAENCQPGTRVIVAGTLNDIALYRTLLSRGVSEYLVEPVQPRQIVDAVASIFEDPTAPPRGKLLAFMGARGGAGSSSVAQNVAWTLSRQSADAVLLIDLDIAFGTSILSYNIDPKQNVADALAQPERLDVTLLERFLVAYDEPLQVLASPAELRHAGLAQLEAVEKLVDLARQLAPIVVLDLPHLWADWVEAMMVLADEAVITAAPDLANLRDGKALIDRLAPLRPDGAAPRLVLNRMDAYRKTQLSAKDFTANLDIVPLAAIPFEPVPFGEAANAGQMVGEIAKGAKAVECFTQIAAALVDKTASGGKKAKAAKGLLGWLVKG